MFYNTYRTRWGFLLVSVCIIALIVWNTFSFFNQLKENERDKMQIWASAQAEFQKSDPTNADVSPIVLDILTSNNTTPMLLYSHKENSYTARNIIGGIKDTLQLTQRFSNENKPIDVVYKNEILQTIYYGNSSIINKIKYYPAFLILILLLFFTAIYFFYKTTKSADQNKLWAGMAKETAHQIGTPLSSLSGWIEILKSENVNAEYIQEIEKDVDRLKTISERFSKIGSKPNLETLDVVSQTHNSFNYLRTRTSKLVEFKLDLPEHPIYVKLNQQLYGWTIENLVKNAIDAMKGKGKITISISTQSKNVLIKISDTGKGIEKKDFTKIFTPGFTTKKRGWGLGLSLAKRIIEDYHKGKIHVLKSSLGKGTTIEIVLKQEN
ncbi:MAG: sensor histidine kinase [Flavobacteriales bacterium]